MTLAEWEALVAGFESGTLPWSAWRHPQHLAVTAWYVRRDRQGELPDRIRAFNAAHGVETTLERGYHETLTRFWLAKVSDVVSRFPDAEVLAALDRELGDKDLPFTYYTRERLMSWDARRGWIAPDLKPWEHA